MSIARIKCDRTDYMLPVGEHLGENLRELFGVKRTHALFLSAFDGDDTLIDPTRTHHVDDGDRYYTVHKKINGG